jgi:hypothetical protein
MFSLATRVALSASALACVVAAFRFRARQNRAGTRGGRISTPKLVWLFFAIWFWLFECAALAFEPSLPAGFRVVFGVHALSMWLRGGVELFMLHVSKNWRPPLGIAHDVLCIVTVLVLLAVFRPAAGAPWGAWSWALVAMLLFSLGVEVLYAALFFRAVDGKTTGDEGTWFASEDEARFRRINRLTTAFNLPQLVFQLALLAAGFSGVSTSSP